MVMILVWLKNDNDNDNDIIMIMSNIVISMMAALFAFVMSMIIDSLAFLFKVFEFLNQADWLTWWPHFYSIIQIKLP